MVVDDDQLRKIYNDFVERIYRYFYIRVCNTEVAQDLTSTTFMKFLDKVGWFDPKKGNISQYIFTIARNTLIDYYRSSKNGKNIKIENVDELCNKDDDNSVVIDRNKEIILKCVDKLSHEEQQYIDLRYTCEYSYKEIAEKLNVPINTVSIKIHRIHKKLKAMLQKNNLKMKLEL